MNVNDLINTLDLPMSSRVDKSVPKKLLLDNGAPTAADKRYINDGIEDLIMLAVLKPTTIGVPVYCDACREYLEIFVLHLSLRSGAKTTRLLELVHRAIPYPVLLLTGQEVQVSVSAAHKRRSQGETGKTVLDGEIIVVDCNAELDEKHWSAFHKALQLGHQPRNTLYALYQGWIDTLLTLHTAKITDTFELPVNAGHSAERREALKECTRLNTEITGLRAAAAKEKQVARQVELNLELKRVEAQLITARRIL